ncbi:helix-turn-helix domain-containing protein [Hymenobacter defluvii]|uniref:AraC family transcriptional regulator n=1 Tax=Hymenobacter defluvii TaxID=2054411 RepID=A0ABS3TA40_9BACT|nr:AraC family transcriptional regulator [Hymenobacter defluvii]MBO3270516.1 AraC family transcriptional regulator [Hymenobacter defluvii]
MAQPAPIPTSDSPEFLRRHMPHNPPLEYLLTTGSEAFFVVPVEQMYQHIPRAVPPTRAIAHSCLFLTSGTATMRVGTDSYTIQAGELLIVRAEQVFSFSPGDINTGFLCHFHPDFLLGTAASGVAYDFLQFWGKPYLSLDTATAGFVHQLLHRLLIEYQEHQLAYPDVLRAYLLALLSELNRAYAASSSGTPTAATQLTNRFKQLLATSLRELHQVGEYAERLHVTPNHLAKAVRTTTGKSPARWIEQTIVLEAKVLLYQSQLTISEVAQEVGVADPSYFSRLFRKHEGVTPLGFRKRMATS